MKFDKLYTGISPIDFEDYEEIFVQWYYGHNNLQWSNIDYSKLIEGYHQMDDHGKDVSRIYVNQLFSLEEIELLKDYLLQERGYDLFILELSLPMKTYFENENGKKQYYQSLYKYAEPDDTINLIYGESYGLHFPVSGCYTPYHNIPKGELPQEYFYNGITLIRYALMSLNYKKNWDDLKLIDILREIYQRNGLYVNFCQNGIVREKDPVEVT